MPGNKRESGAARNGVVPLRDRPLDPCRLRTIGRNVVGGQLAEYKGLAEPAHIDRAIAEIDAAGR
jgi:hypothetical protein